MPTFPNYPSGQPTAQTLLQFSVPGTCPDAYTSIANVISGPDWSRKIDKVETTAHPTAQTSSAVVPRTYVPVLKDATMSFTLSVKTDSAAYAEFIAIVENAQSVDWRIVEADSLSSVIVFNGFFTDFSQKRSVNGKAEATCQVQVNGEIGYSV